MAEPDPIASSVERELFGEPTLTGRQISERTGLPLETLMAMRRALGLSVPDPDEVAHDETDLGAAERTKRLLEAGVPEHVLIASSRVLGHGMARWAETARDLWIVSFVEPDDDPEETARRLAAMAKAFLPQNAHGMQHVFKMHLREVLRHEVAALETRAPGGGRNVEVAVGFADIVGFTAMGEELEEDEMGGIAERLASRASDLATSPVKLVKTLGDGVLLVCPQSPPLVDVLLALVEDPEGPSVRAGAAFGPVHHRLGDYYGRTVNLASRVADRARPDSVLVTPEVADSLGDDGYQLSPTPPKDLKGIGATRLVRVRRETSGV